MGYTDGGRTIEKKDKQGKKVGPSAPHNPAKPTNLPSSGGNNGSRGSGAVGGGNSFVGGRGFGLNNSHSGKQLPRKAKKHKGLVSKISNKRLAKSLYRQKLNDNADVVKSEAKGVTGLFKRNPLLAYSLLVGGIIAVLGVLAAGIWFLYKRGLISLNWLLRY